MKVAAKPRVLLLTYGVPWPLNAGARIRDYHLLKGLAGRAEVILCCFAQDETEIPDTSELRKLCREVRVYRPVRRSLWERAGAILEALEKRLPVATWPFFYPELASELRSIAEREAVEIFQIEHSILAGYACSAPEGCSTVLSFHNVGWVQYARMARLKLGFRRRADFWIKARLMKRCESRYAGRFSHAIAVSRTDAALLRRANPSLPVSVVANGVDCGRLQPLPDAPSGNDILFTGVLGYPPNADAVRFFCREILPRIRREAPDARLLIAGQSAPPEVRSLADGEAVSLRSDVDDVIPCYRQARLVVVPLRAGSGTRLKILEAMALGRAVVSTSIGCEGLDVSHGNDILIADEPGEFSACVVSLLRDGARRTALAARARETAERNYDWPDMAARQLEVYSSLVNRKDCLHLYLSPHFDDAILSCGGLIHVQRQAGERAGVLTLCGGLPVANSLSPLARCYEAGWGKSGGVAARRAENASALSGWGVAVWDHATSDAIFRNGPQAPYYANRADLFGEPRPEDAAAVLPAWEAQVKDIAGKHGRAVVLYAPLAIGGHVDHELARRLGQHFLEEGWTVRFYEDYPYVELEPGTVEEALTRFGPHTWSSQTTAIDVRAKIEAVRKYRSQIGRVFGGEKDMVRRITEFTAGTACALSARERIRSRLARSGVRLRLWRRLLGYHAHAERIWMCI